MKKILLLLSLFYLSVVLFGADITTLDGTVYKNTEVLNTMPDGILVNYVGESGFSTVKLLNFNELPVLYKKNMAMILKKPKNLIRHIRNGCINSVLLLLKKKKKRKKQLSCDVKK